jgi:hypothetical protein
VDDVRMSVDMLLVGKQIKTVHIQAVCVAPSLWLQFNVLDFPWVFIG